MPGIIGPSERTVSGALGPIRRRAAFLGIARARALGPEASEVMPSWDIEKRKRCESKEPRGEVRLR